MNVELLVMWSDPCWAFHINVDGLVSARFRCSSISVSLQGEGPKHGICTFLYVCRHTDACMDVGGQQLGAIRRSKCRSVCGSALTQQDAEGRRWKRQGGQSRGRRRVKKERISNERRGEGEEGNGEERRGGDRSQESSTDSSSIMYG